jgi:phosphatidylglycerol:prolipoprotein diacylglycerol transferase
VLFPKESPAGVCGVPVIPVQLIESFVLVLIFFILIITRRFKKYDGDIFFIYIILYGTARFIIEFYRADYRGSILNVSTSQFIALVLVPIGIIMLFRARIIKSGK